VLLIVHNFFNVKGTGDYRSHPEQAQDHFTIATAKLQPEGHSRVLCEGNAKPVAKHPAHFPDRIVGFDV
jgi:hypothetical protein